VIADPVSGRFDLVEERGRGLVPMGPGGAASLALSDSVMPASTLDLAQKIMPSAIIAAAIAKLMCLRI
jgi:hypothetical protein